MTQVLARTTIGPSWEYIRGVCESRRAAQSPLMQKMAEVRTRYNADYVLVDPTNSSDETMSALTPAIINEAIDQPALRAASVMPNLYVPALQPGKINGAGSINYALTRRAAIAATWHDSMLPLVLRKCFRQLRAYSTCCMVVVPDWLTGAVRIEARDPLTALPEPKAPEDISLPHDAAFIQSLSAGQIRRMFPRAAQENGGPIPLQTDMSELWDLIEWIDEECIVYGVLGPRYPEMATFRGSPDARAGEPSRELARYENKAGCCAVVAPHAVSLDTAISQIGQIIGHMDLSAQLMMLEIQAVRASIWPDRYIIGSQTGGAPSIVGGSWNPGSSGKVNLLENVQNVGELRGTPDPTVERIQDRLERNARVTSGAIPQFSGEGGGALRTGRGIDTMGAWSIDGRVQELQEVMEYALGRLNVAVVKTYKGCFGAKKFHLFDGKEYVDFTPNKELEDTGNAVSYAISGADKQGTTVILGQMLGTKLMSHETARTLHPDIRDPEGERRRIVEENLDEALMVSILQRSAQPDSPGAIVPEDAAKIRHLVREGYTLDAAVLEASKSRQAIQAQQAQMMQGGPTDGSAPMDPNAMQPGLAGPNEGASPGQGLAGGPGVMSPDQAPGFGVEGPGPDMDRLRMLTNALRSTHRAV